MSELLSRFAHLGSVGYRACPAGWTARARKQQGHRAGAGGRPLVCKLVTRMQEWPESHRDKVAAKEILGFLSVSREGVFWLLCETLVPWGFVLLRF